MRFTLKWPNDNCKCSRKGESNEVDCQLAASISYKWVQTIKTLMFSKQQEATNRVQKMASATVAGASVTQNVAHLMHPGK